MKYSAPCQKWADKLIASHVRSLPPSDYLLLKEHLLTCPYCTAAHRNYLSIEAQIHNMSVLQPQRQLSAKLLLEIEVQKKNVRVPDAASWTKIAQKRTDIILASYSARLKNLVVALLRPGYALILLLFCLLTTVVGIGTMGYASQRTPASTVNLASMIQSPRLVANTTDIALTIATDLSEHLPTPHDQTISLLANATIILKNVGDQPLIWNFNSTRSAIFSPYNASTNATTITTQPSHGILKGNAYLSVLIVASGISYEQFVLNRTGNFAQLVFTSNGGDVSLQAICCDTEVSSVVPQLSLAGGRDHAQLSTSPHYLLRKQKL